MLGFSEGQIMAWLSPLWWPFLRTLALFATAPVFSMRAIPMRVKIGLAFFIALCAQAMLAPQPIIGVNDREALGAVAQQVAVGMGLGFAVRIVFAALEMAGEVIGLQMGLNFAAFFDPASGGQLSAVGRFFGHMATLLFVVINGHLVVLLAVVKSFEFFPVDGNFFASLAQMRLFELGSALFSSAFWLALPLIALMLFVNLTLGIISRVAPQMNIYAIGFPVTLTVGMVGIAALLPLLEQPLLTLLYRALDIFQK